MCRTVDILDAASRGFGHLSTLLSGTQGFCCPPTARCVLRAVCCAVPRWMMRMFIKSAIGPIFPFIRATPLIVWFYR